MCATHGVMSGVKKAGICFALMTSSVSATAFTQASKIADGTYPYNTFVIPCLVELVKFLVTSSLVLSTRTFGWSFTNYRCKRDDFSQLLSYSFPAFCYFISNNSAFYIIRDSGATVYQITNNLKVFTTALFMRPLLGRKLSWQRWRSLVILVMGSALAHLDPNNEPQQNRQTSSKYGLFSILINVSSAGAGGAYSEMLLKGMKPGCGGDIHTQNLKLYFFGVLFGLISFILQGSTENHTDGFLHGFNGFAYAAVVSLTIYGILVSYTLKYLDNLAKCFVTAASMFVVAVLDAGLQNQSVSPYVYLGIILVCLALLQYHST